MPRAANPLFNANRLKLGTFCTNTVNATTLSPDLRRPTWEGCLAAGRLADAAGFEAITPIARWKGYVDGNPDHVSHEIMDAFTFAAAMAQATSHSAIFATTHAPTIHPVAVAKMAATIDHISGGRFAMNVVGGWNRREFDMFGIQLLEHDARYAYLADWLGVVRRLWSGEEFDHHSPYLALTAALARPRPLQASIPIMNAALSPVGLRFAVEHADICFCSPRGDDIAGWRDQVDEYKRNARELFGREVQVWTNVSMIQRADRASAEAYRKLIVEDQLDHAAIDSMITTMVRENGWDPEGPQAAFMRDRMSGGSGFPVIGSAANIAADLAQMTEVGIDGVLITWVDYLDGIQRFVADVMPLLETGGLRAAHRPDAAVI